MTGKAQTFSHLKTLQAVILHIIQSHQKCSVTAVLDPDKESTLGGSPL